MVKLRKSASHGYIKVYEVVVTSLGKGQEQKQSLLFP